MGWVPITCTLLLHWTAAEEEKYSWPDPHIRISNQSYTQFCFTSLLFYHACFGLYVQQYIQMLWMLNMHLMNASNQPTWKGWWKLEKRNTILKHFFETLERCRAMGVRTEAGESKREECTEHVFPQRLSTIWSRFRFRKGEQGGSARLWGGVCGGGRAWGTHRGFGSSGRKKGSWARNRKFGRFAMVEILFQI